MTVISTPSFNFLTRMKESSYCFQVGNYFLFFPLPHVLQLSIQLCRLSEDLEVPVLHLEIEALGTELKVRTFDMTSYTFLREICLECSEYIGIVLQCAPAYTLLYRLSSRGICHVEFRICFLCLKTEKTKFTSSPLRITRRMIC